MSFEGAQHAGANDIVEKLAVRLPTIQPFSSVSTWIYFLTSKTIVHLIVVLAFPDGPPQS